MDVLADVLEVARGARRAGLRPVVYTGQWRHWFVAQRGLALPAREIGDLWVPWYGRSTAPRLPVGPAGEPAPWANWRLWQFAGSRTHPGRVVGIEGPVDLNWFRGDEDELARWWAGERGAQRTWQRELEDLIAELEAVASRAKRSGFPMLAREIARLAAGALVIPVDNEAR